MNHVLYRLQWTLRHYLGGLGWPGGLGAALVALALAYAATTHLPLRERIEAMRSDSENLRARIGASRRTSFQLESARQLADFYEFFPDETQIPEGIQHIQEAATDEGLVIERGDYRLQDETSVRLVRYEIEFPVRGRYSKLRRFIAKALKSTPNLTLDSVSFSRHSVSEAAIDARIRFILYLRKAER